MTGSRGRRRSAARARPAPAGTGSARGRGPAPAGPRTPSSTAASPASSSARSVAIRFAKPKKSSARRKNPRWVRVAQVSVMALARARTPSSVGSSAASAVPAVIAREAIASASRTVDLPDPFSPTRSVTGVSKCRVRSVLTAGRSNGKPRRRAGRGGGPREGGSRPQSAISVRVSGGPDRAIQPPDTAGGRQRRTWDPERRAIGGTGAETAGSGACETPPEGGNEWRRASGD